MCRAMHSGIIQLWFPVNRGVRCPSPPGIAASICLSLAQCALLMVLGTHDSPPHFQPFVSSPSCDSIFIPSTESFCTSTHEKRRLEDCIQAPMPLFLAPFCPHFCLFFCVSVTNLLSGTDFSLPFQGWKGTDFAAANGATPCKIRASPFFPIIP